MRDYEHENLYHDPLHGYIPYVSTLGLNAGEVSEQQIIEHPWLQRMRQIHQLQTAWYVYPTAEHSRFEHILGVMHMGSRVIDALYDSLKEVCPDTPSKPFVDSLMRMSGLLHDVGHGPFGHFFDEHFLSHHNLTHETLGSQIIENELGEVLIGIRRSPAGEFAENEVLQPSTISFLITRPNETQDTQEQWPKWLVLLRSLFCGLYTVDNMDFVLRDSYMTGFSAKPFDLERILHYSFFSPDGLTIHKRGLPALTRFISVRGELFRNVYFHRTIKAIDLTLAELFAESKEYLFPGNPLDHLDDYLYFTEWSLLVDVARWVHDGDEKKRNLGHRWRAFMAQEKQWVMAAEHTLFFDALRPERQSIFRSTDLVEQDLRDSLPDHLKQIDLKIDLPRHVHRPAGPTGLLAISGLNHLFDPDTQKVQLLSDAELFKEIPISYRICRVYARNLENRQEIGQALKRVVNPGGIDDTTNM